METSNSIYSMSEIFSIVKYLDDIKEAVKYINFAASPNPNKGSSGAVCPFLPKAIKNDTIRCAIIDNETFDVDTISTILDDYIKLFLDFSKGEKELKIYYSLIILFPNMNTKQSELLLTTIHKEYKKKMVYDGLMIGEFFPSNEKVGLYSDSFHPLRSQVPMIAIRYLIPEDILFLNNDSDSIEDRIEYLKGYIHSLGDILNENKLNSANCILKRHLTDKKSIV